MTGALPQKGDEKRKNNFERERERERGTKLLERKRGVSTSSRKKKERNLSYVVLSCGETFSFFLSFFTHNCQFLFLFCGERMKSNENGCSVCVCFSLYIYYLIFQNNNIK